MLQVMIKDMKELFRDKSLLFFTVFFPSMLVFLLGNLLAFADHADTAIDPIAIQYVVETRDHAGNSAIEAFTENLEDVEQFQIQKVSDLEKARDLASHDEITAAVLFEEPFGIQIFTGGNDIQNRAVNSLFTSFSRQSGAMLTVLSLAPQNMAKLRDGAPRGDYVKAKDLGVNRSMLDYYAVTMAVMILFMGGMGGAISIQEERRERTLQRLLVSPKSRTLIYVQKIVGSLPQVFIQVAVVMLVSALLFEANYASAWQHNLLLFCMMLMVGLTVMSVCAIFGILVKANAMLVLMPVLWVMMFMSGTFSKEINIEGFNQISPISQIQNAAFDLTIFGRTDKAYAVILVSAAVFLVSLTAGALLFKRREVTA